MYYNDEYGAYCDVNAHHRGQKVQIKTKGSYIHPTPDEARKLASELLRLADEVDDVASLYLGPCPNCGESRVRALNLEWGDCLDCGTDDIPISDRIKAQHETKDKEATQ